MGLEAQTSDSLSEEAAVIQDGDAIEDKRTEDPMGGELIISTDDISDDWYYADGVKGQG